MSGRMKKYRENLNNIPDPIMPSEIPQIKLDLRGLMTYAKSSGKKVSELLDEEKMMFIK